MFIPLKETEDGHFISGKPVIPFSPRTLEHCILHMTGGQKVEDGEFLYGYEKKCRKIQEYSCYESDDWDKVIEFGEYKVFYKNKSSSVIVLANNKEIKIIDNLNENVIKLNNCGAINTPERLNKKLISLK